ncbi:MAG TPA: hypothetical protein VFZ19_09900 [Solirubrobacterales bacterium]
MSAVVDPEETATILERALAYPYSTPDRSYLYLDGEARELPGAGADLSARTPLLSYGANAAPDALARKLAALPGVEMPVMRSQLAGFDVVYSAHVSPYGAVPATLLESPGTTAPVFVIHPTAEQRALLTASEPNYDLVEVDGIAAYRSKHGCLEIGGTPVALAALRSLGRTLPELDEPAVLEHVRARLAPELTLAEFVRDCVERGGIRLP